MKFAAVYRDKLNAPPFSDAPMEALGAWLRLATTAAASESDTIAISEGSSSRTIMLTTGLMKAEIDKAIAAKLCRWTPKGLFIEGYDYHGQRVFESKRRAGKRGGISKASKHSPSIATAQPEAQLEHSSSPLLSSPLLSLPEDQTHTRVFADENPESEYQPPKTAMRLVGSEVAVRARTKPAYPLAFEEIWNGTGQRGTKLMAMKAWVKSGRPPWTDVRSAWEAYMASERPVAGYVKDLSTWFNGSGHTQEWQPAAGASRAVDSGVATIIAANNAKLGIRGGGK